MHERLAAVSDDADHFNGLRHALCSIHATLLPKTILRRRFGALFTQNTRYQTLNQLPLRLHSNNSELLLALECPAIPGRTNVSERNNRDYVKKRKVGGGTRSDLGRQCRTTFISLEKSSRRRGLSFWAYMNDRIVSPTASRSCPPLSRPGPLDHNRHGLSNSYQNDASNSIAETLLLQYPR